MKISEQLGTVENLGFDQANHERRRRLEAIAACHRCGGSVGLWSDTEEWHAEEGRLPRWRHAHYGPAQGVCCGLLYVSDFNGARVFDLGTPASSEDARR
jgi:hypothetical protein